MKILSALALLAASASAVYEPGHLPLLDTKDFRMDWFHNKVDHVGKNNKMYLQRFWHHDKYWDTTDGPIFLYICGEWTCSPPDDK